MFAKNQKFINSGWLVTTEYVLLNINYHVNRIPSDQILGLPTSDLWFLQSDCN